ncbi:MAG: hypothetical protein R2795_18590 [Saprospiraceae bacterium]
MPQPPRTALGAAPVGQSWSADISNPATAAIDPSTGEVTGMTADGDYTFILDNLGCTAEVVISRVQAPVGGEQMTHSVSTKQLTCPMPELTKAGWPIPITPLLRLLMRVRVQ